MKITLAMIVCNEALFLERNLRNHYRFADEIIIVEGAVEKYAQIIGSNNSVDKTVEIIKTFPDPMHKITFIQTDGRAWKDKIELQNAFCDKITGDILWKIDADEFYKPEDVEKIFEAYREDPELVLFYPFWYHFWGNGKTILKGGKHQQRWDEFHCKIWKWQEHYRYKTTHNRLSDGDKEISHRTHPFTTIEGLYCYHYGYLKPQEWQKKKFEFYEARGDFWYGQDISGGNTVPFNGEHPKIMKGLI